MGRQSDSADTDVNACYGAAAETIYAFAIGAAAPIEKRVICNICNACSHVADYLSRSPM